jgi:beta-carotene 3-hydroxylase
MNSLLHYLIAMLLVVGAVAFMEWFAAWSHEHIMHGWGWGWHKSHHEPNDGVLEKNDLYAVFFAAFSIVLYVAGNWLWPLWWVWCISAGRSSMCRAKATSSASTRPTDCITQ